MKTIKYVLCNYKIYLSSIFITCLLILFSSFFVNDYSSYKQYYNALNNNTCRFVAYDSYGVSEDCFSFYGKEVDVYIDNPEDLLNVNVYGFLENVDYSYNSLINESNVSNGTFKILDSQEVAISLNTANRYSLFLGDSLYVSNTECEIVFIFNSIYEVNSYDMHTDVQSIFVGKNTLEKTPEWYCNFNPTDETHHSFLYNMNVIRNDVKNNIVIKNIVIVIVSILLCGLVSFLKIKSESNMILNSVIMGNSKISIDIVLIEFLYLLMPTLLLCSLLSWNIFKYLLPYQIISLIVQFLVNLLIYLVYLRRIHKYE